MGTNVVSPRYHQDGKNIALMYEVSNPGALELWFANHLNQALIKNGYTVIERLNYTRVLRGFMGNEGIASSGQVATNYFEAFSIANIYGFTPTEIKEIGKSHGLDYLAVFSQWPNRQAALRIVDCKTVEVVATSVFTMPATGSSVRFTPDVADVFVLSLKYAIGQKDNNGNPKPVYIDIAQEKKKEGKWSKIDKILYQKNINVTGISRYATIFTISID